MARIPKLSLQFVHIVVAVYNSKYLRGQEPQKRAYSAVQIAKANMAKYGFADKRSEHWPPEKLKERARGRKASARHRRERGKATKRKQFEQIWRLYKLEEGLMGDREKGIR